jgi:hypothetical protein
LSILNCAAQNNFYDYLKLGVFQVGFKDTLIFDAALQYEAFGYEGVKPYFIQIWHPINKEPNDTKHLTFGDFFELSKSAELSIVRDSLRKHFEEIIVRDYLEQISSADEKSIFTEPHEDFLSEVKSICTKSVLQKSIAKNHYPVIIYHHGSQSNSFENYAMAEYFASRGFIFVSANFHLPFENTIFGLKPFSQIIQGEEEQSLKTVLTFAQTLSNSPFVFFVGHSLGAQIGLRTFDLNSSIKGFISLETTIEFKSDDKKIKELWPEVYQKIVIEKAQYPFPIVFCAATGIAKPFDFFKDVQAPQLIFASTVEDFEHNAYTSNFYFRFVVSKGAHGSNHVISNRKFNLYVKHLELIEDFFYSILTNEVNIGIFSRLINPD